MSASWLTELGLPRNWELKSIRTAYEFTKKPRGLNVKQEGKIIPFFTMAQIPLGKITVSDFTPKPAEKLGSGTYVENGDVMVAKITPSFENGKQAIVDIASDFAYATTEVIPLRGIQNKADNQFLFFFLRHPEVRANLAGKMEGSTGRQRLSKDVLGDCLIPLPPLSEQKKIAYVLSTVQRAIEQQEQIIATATELKKALMHKLFTEGLRGEPQKQTEIGPVPKSWEVRSIESFSVIKASAMSYSELGKARNVDNGVCVMGVKVSDMNLSGNERSFTSANLERKISKSEAEKRTVPANAIVFPKRGAAIATNKKRLTTCWSVLDPNLIAVRPNKEVHYKYLYHWFNTFDLRLITDPGPTPQLNKKDIAPLKCPAPSLEEQIEIASCVDLGDQKIALASAKQRQLQELFNTLLHELMTAKIRVHTIKFMSKESIL